MKSWLAIGILLAPLSALGEPAHLNPPPRGGGGGKRPTAPTSEEAPVKIVCDDMVVQNRQQTARCKGHVHATRLLMVVTSDQGLAHYDKDGHIIDLISTGNVRMTEKDRVATGDKAVYVEELRTIELTGHAVARQGNDVLTGEPLVFYVDEDRVVAKGASLLGKSTDLPQGHKADGGAPPAQGSAPLTSPGNSR